MATNFKTTVIPEIGTTPSTLVSSTPNSRNTIIGLSLSNITESIVKVSVTLTDSANTTGYYIKDILIPPNASLKVVNGGEKLILSSSCTLSVLADSDASVDAVVSYVELI